MSPGCLFLAGSVCLSAGLGVGVWAARWRGSWSAGRCRDEMSGDQVGAQTAGRAGAVPPTATEAHAVDLAATTDCRPEVAGLGQFQN